MTAPANSGVTDFHVFLNRVACFGSVARGLIHELRNPLQSITMAGGVLTEADSSDQAGRLSSLIERESGRMSELFNMLSSSLHPRKRPPAPHIISDLIKDVNHMQSIQRPLLNTTVDVEIVDDSVVYGTGEELRHAILNLITNAKEAAEESDQPRVTIRVSSDGDQLFIEICDNGPGFRDESMWDIYATTKEDHLGLGLPVARHLLERWEGTVSLTSTSPGTRAFVTLPVHQRS